MDGRTDTCKWMDGWTGTQNASRPDAAKRADRQVSEWVGARKTNVTEDGLTTSRVSMADTSRRDSVPFTVARRPLTPNSLFSLICDHNFTSVKLLKVMVVGPRPSPSTRVAGTDGAKSTTSDIRPVRPGFSSQMRTKLFASLSLPQPVRLVGRPPTQRSSERR